MIIPMMVAVQAGEVAEVGGTLIRGDGPFPVARYGGNVVVEMSGKHLVTEIICHVHDIGLG